MPYIGKSDKGCYFLMIFKDIILFMDRENIGFFPFEGKLVWYEGMF